MYIPVPNDAIHNVIPEMRSLFEKVKSRVHALSIFRIRYSTSSVRFCRSTSSVRFGTFEERNSSAQACLVFLSKYITAPSKTVIPSLRTINNTLLFSAIVREHYLTTLLHCAS